MSHVHGQLYDDDLFPIPMVQRHESLRQVKERTMSKKSTHSLEEKKYQTIY